MWQNPRATPDARGKAGKARGRLGGRQERPRAARSVNSWEKVFEHEAKSY